MKKSIKKVWCSICIEKRPPIIKPAKWLVPFRVGHYTLLPDQSDFDLRLVAVCDECLATKNKFQRDNKIVVDIDNKNLIYKNV